MIDDASMFFPQSIIVSISVGNCWEFSKLAFHLPMDMSGGVWDLPAPIEQFSHTLAK